jgi:glycosyltransferase involved in cell wall biosynthesis
MPSNPRPLVSIVIPVYNGSDYLAQAIDSALAQTYENFEVIVVNDGSKDGGKTREIALSYGDKVRYFEKENGGVATALNFGIEKMKGEYFSWLSHDDLYYPDKIRSQMELLENGEAPADAIVYSCYETIDAKSRLLAVVNPANRYSREKLNIPLFPVLRGLIHGCAVLIHKSHFQRAGTFDPGLPTTQDYDLWFRMFRDAKVVFHEKVLVKSRCHPNQGSKTLYHAAECNQLWISMIDRTTPEEMRRMEGDIYRFYRKTADFLKETPYEDAYGHAKALAGSVQELITVIIPFYNRIPYVLESIKSVQAQTYRNFELLLIDDGSTEDVSQVKQLAAEDPRIVYVKQENEGVSVARNRGIAIARGEYIAFLDSDDLFHPEKLEKQLQFMKEGLWDFSHTSYQQINLAGKPLKIVDTSRMSGKVFPRIMSCCCLATPTVMIRKEILSEERRFKNNIGIGEDVCLWIDLAYEHPFGCVTKPLTKVRVSENSAANDRSKQITGIFNILEHIIRNPRYLAYESEVRTLLTNYSYRFSAESEPAPASLPPSAFEPDPADELRILKSSLYFKAYEKLRKKKSMRYLSGIAVKPALRASWWVYKNVRKMMRRASSF